MNVTANLSLPKSFYGMLPFRNKVAEAFDTLDAAVGQVLTGTKAAHNPASLIDGASESTTVTVTGVALGDVVLGLSFALDLQGIELTGYVSAADTVTVHFHNRTGGTIDLAAGDIVAVVRKAA